MASSAHRLAANFRAVIAKAAGIRLSDVDSRDTTDYAEIIVGDGVPSGAYGRAAGVTMVYLRKDATASSACMYVTVNGGTNWIAVQPVDDSDYLVRATIAVADATSSATTALLTLDLFHMDGTSVLLGARQVLIVWYATQYAPSAANNTTTTLGTATKGSIVAQGNSWALVETDADGEFDCTVTNSADETLYFSVRTVPAGNSDAAKGCVVVASNSDSATWSA